MAALPCSPDDSEAITYHYQRFMTTLRQAANELNVPIKDAESWASTVLLAYSKDMYLFGTPLPFSLKKAVRLNGETCEYTPTLPNMLLVTSC